MPALVAGRLGSRNEGLGAGEACPLDLGPAPPGLASLFLRAKPALAVDAAITVSS